MDFIDPLKRRHHKIRLILGYVVLGTAILLTALILLYQANGYGFGKNGQIIQNGLVFVASTPSPANIYLNGSLSQSATNARLELPAGQYTLQLTRRGYRPWIRAIGVEGDSVEDFTYPFLFPTDLVTTSVQDYSVQPALETQSPNRQWLLLEQPASVGSFDEYDLSNPKQLATTVSTIAIPTGILTASTGDQSLQLVSWSADNRHVLLLHTYSGGSEYIMFDRQVPSDSLNLTKTLGLSSGVQLSLNNAKYDQYYLYDPTAQTLSTASINTPAPVVLQNQVLSYTTYGGSSVLYVTSTAAPAGKVDVDIEQGTVNYVLTQLPVSPTYELSITQYSGHNYIIVAASNDAKQYIYEDPISQLSNGPLVPIYILKVTQPDFVSFSANSQFAMAENGSNFAVYDAENNKSYSYTLTETLPAGDHASWMDGNHLMVVVGGKVIVFDYDDANQQTLEPGIDGTVPVFDPSYKWIYSLAPTSSLTTTASGTSATQASGISLTSTSLLVPADQ